MEFWFQLFFADVAEKYSAHPESKSLGPDAEPCGRGTVRSARDREIKLIGEESNRLEDRIMGLITADELDERLTVYHGKRWVAEVHAAEAAADGIREGCRCRRDQRAAG
jgi:hypothetical protein